MSRVTLEDALIATMSRRRMLATSLGLMVSTVVAACTGLGRSAQPASPSAGAATPSSTPSSSAIATPACIVTPAETEGPYFVDERLNRSDITTDPSGSPARTGVPLTLVFNVYRAAAGACSALSGAQVDVWHCDAMGVYSDVAGSPGTRFLRGYQVTDASGAVRFETVYPGWYSGRAVHIHFKLRTFSGSQKTYEFTSQVFFDDSATDEVYRQAPYSSRGGRDTRNATDMVYTSNGSSGSKLLVSLSQRPGGYTATFGVGLNMA